MGNSTKPLNKRNTDALPVNAWGHGNPQAPLEFPGELLLGNPWSIHQTAKG